MIKVNNNNIDIILQVEEHTSIQKIFDVLTLDINEILIICPELFIQRFIQNTCDEIDEFVVHNINKNLEENNGYTEMTYFYKNKGFHFNFIVLSSEEHVINTPFKSNQKFNIGFKEIKIN